MALIADTLKMAGGWMQANRDRRAAEKDAEKRMAFVNDLDWQPEFAADYAPAYKKSQSPVARAYLESILSGANPDLIPSYRQGASDLKADAQTKQNAMYGTPEERVKKQQEILDKPLYEIKRPEHIISADNRDYKSGRAIGLTDEEMAKMTPEEIQRRIQDYWSRGNVSLSGSGAGSLINV